MTIHRKALVDDLQTNFGFTATQSDFIVRDFFDIISENLIAGKDVRLSGFGNFLLRNKTARPGRNVATNEVITVLPRRVVSFKAGVKARNMVKDNIEMLKKRLGID